jgi:hypothetical protein
LLFHYRDAWHVNTSGSFGLGLCGDSGQPWWRLFWDTARLNTEVLDTRCTYVFELWTPWNKVVRMYPKPQVWLRAVFDHEHPDDSREYARPYRDLFAKMLGVPHPGYYRLQSHEAVTKYLEERTRTDPTFEGVVVLDQQGRRFKIKSETYLALHHFHDNGNIAKPKHLVPLVLAGEVGEIRAYFPEAAPYLDEVELKLADALAELTGIWEEAWQIPDQKTFAQAVVTRTRLSSILFNLRKQHGANQDPEKLREAFRASGELLLKVLYPKREVAE